MPRVRTNATRRPPDGFDDIAPTLNQFEVKMRQVENDPGNEKRLLEMSWDVFKVHHARSRYVYNLYYVRGVISRELYEWLLEEEYGDRALIAKWKKVGYEKLCCLGCVQTRDHNFGTTCICRVPKDQLDAEQVVECVTCGCRGCASGDVPGRTTRGPNAKQRRKERRAHQRAAAVGAADDGAGASSTSAVVQYLEEQRQRMREEMAASAPPPSSSASSSLAGDVAAAVAGVAQLRAEVEADQ